MKDRMILVPARLVESAISSARATRNLSLAEELRQLLCFEQTQPFEKYIELDDGFYRVKIDHLGNTSWELIRAKEEK